MERHQECHDETVTKMVTETIMEQHCTDITCPECHDETVTEISITLQFALREDSIYPNSSIPHIDQIRKSDIQEHNADTDTQSCNPGNIMRNPKIPHFPGDHFHSRYHFR